MKPGGFYASIMGKTYDFKKEIKKRNLPEDCSYDMLECSIRGLDLNTTSHDLECIRRALPLTTTERDLECLRWCVSSDASDWELEQAKINSLSTHGR